MAGKVAGPPKLEMAKKKKVSPMSSQEDGEKKGSQTLKVTKKKAGKKNIGY